MKASVNESLIKPRVPAGLIDNMDQTARFALPSAGKYETLIKQAILPDALIELRRFDWYDLHEGMFQTPAAFVILTEAHGQGGYGSPPNEWSSLGAIRFFPGGLPFYARWREDQQIVLFVAVDIKALTGLGLDLDRPRLRECCDLRNSYLHSLLTRVQRELREPGFATELTLESASFAVATELLHHFASQPAKSRARGDTLRPDDVRRIASRLREEGQFLSLEQLASQEGLSARQFARLFKEATGEGIGTFSARQILLRSKDLLSQRELLMKEIAFRCGFASTTAFSRAFRKMEGCTPQDYRKRLGVIGNEAL